MSFVKQNVNMGRHFKSVFKNTQFFHVYITNMISVYAVKYIVR